MSRLATFFANLKGDLSMQKLSFDAGWEFTDAVGMFGMQFGQWSPVTLPQDYSITQPRDSKSPAGGGGGYAWSGTITYRKKFQVPEEWSGKSIQLEFEGVYMNAKVSSTATWRPSTPTATPASWSISRPT